MSRTLKVIAEARRCTLCADVLPMEPRPLLQGSGRSRVMVIGQAPGLKTHEAGGVWLDPSGDRLRDWLGVRRGQFYDARLFALIPMGFCYPGKGRSGDAPPRPECAPTWHPRLIKAMPGVRLTVLLGRYALQRYCPDRYKTTTDAVRDYKKLLGGGLIVLPHPSPRNNIWLKKHPWFAQRALPALRKRVASVLQS